MLPSRGLRPAHFAPFSSRPSLYVRSIGSRQFSSIPRNTTFSAPSRRTSPLQSAHWRASASNPHAVFLNASTVRYGSWYAPWTWGQSSTSSLDAVPTTAAPEFVAEPVVRSATPELAPAGIDKAPVVEGTTAAQSAPGQGGVEQLVDDILNAEYIPAPEIVADPTTAVTHFHALKDMGLDYGWGPTAFFEWLSSNVYIYSGTGWGISIIASAVVLRCILFPLQLRASDNMAKMAALTPVLADLHTEMTAAMRSGDQAKVAVMKRRQRGIYTEAELNPLTGFIPLGAQMVLGFGAWRCLRGMADLPVPGFSQGGLMWFHDLTLADPYYLLPCISGGVMYVLMKLGGETGATNQTMSPGTMFFMSTVMPVVLVVLTARMPAGVQLYLLCATLLGALSSAGIRQPGFRTRFNLAPLPTPEAQAAWTKVARGEIAMDKVTTPDGRVKAFAPGRTSAHSRSPSYQPPTTPRSRTQHRGLNLKAGAAIPMHIQGRESAQEAHARTAYPDRDYDYDSPPNGYFDKVDWFARNFRPLFLWRRWKAWLAGLTGNKTIKKRLMQGRDDMVRIKAREEEARRRLGRR